MTKTKNLSMKDSHSLDIFRRGFFQNYKHIFAAIILLNSILISQTSQLNSRISQQENITNIPNPNNSLNTTNARNESQPIPSSVQTPIPSTTSAFNITSNSSLTPSSNLIAQPTPIQTNISSIEANQTSALIPASTPTNISSLEANQTSGPIPAPTITASDIKNFDPKKYYNGNFVKVNPSLIPEVRLANATCFQTMLPAITYLSDFEQAVLVKSSLQNQDNSRCIDCKFYIDNLPNILKKDLATFAQLLNFQSWNNRDPLRCLLSYIYFGEGNTSVIPNSVNNKNSILSQDPMIKGAQQELSEYVYAQTIGNHCASKFIRDAAYIFAERKRFFCAKNEDLENMAIYNKEMKITGFKYTLQEVEKLTDIFNNFVQCKSLEKIVYPQAINKAYSFLAENICKDNNQISQLPGRALFSKST